MLVLGTAEGLHYEAVFSEFIDSRSVFRDVVLLKDCSAYPFGLVEKLKDTFFLCHTGLIC